MPMQTDIRIMWIFKNSILNLGLLMGCRRVLELGLILRVLVGLANEKWLDLEWVWWLPGVKQQIEWETKKDKL